MGNGRNCSRGGGGGDVDLEGLTTSAPHENFNRAREYCECIIMIAECNFVWSAIRDKINQFYFAGIVMLLT